MHLFRNLVFDGVSLGMKTSKRLQSRFLPKTSEPYITNSIWNLGFKTKPVVHLTPQPTFPFERFFDRRFPGFAECHTCCTVHLLFRARYEMKPAYQPKVFRANYHASLLKFYFTLSNWFSRFFWYLLVDKNILACKRNATRTLKLTKMTRLTIAQRSNADLDGNSNRQ